MGGAHPIFIHSWISILLEVLPWKINALPQRDFPTQPSQKHVNSEALEEKQTKTP